MRRGFALVLTLLMMTGCTGADTQTARASCSALPIATMPVDIRGNMLFVQAVIAGEPVTLLADTGAERTLLTETAVRNLDLTRDPLHATRTYGIGTPTVTRDAKLPDGIRLGGVQLPLHRVSVGGFAISPVAGTVADGLLGADVLMGFDVDLDLPARRITLYRPRGACPFAPPPWGQPYTAIAGIVSKDDRLLVPFVLDGVPGMGVLDSGAQLSSISRAMAERTGLPEASLRADRTVVAHGAAPEEITAWIHRFRELRVGPAVIEAPTLPVVTMTDGMGDALIGADFLRGRRVWLSFTTAQVFVTPLARSPMIAVTRSEVVQ